jgi:hypothetical protein
MKTAAKTVDEYLQSLPEERRAVVNAVRKVIRANLPEGYAECVQYGMIGYVVPHSIYPAGYHCDPRQPLPIAGLAAQKNYFAMHLMAVYGHPETEQWFRKAYLASGKKLDMGKACVRFKKVDDLPLEVIGQLIARVPVKAYVARVQKFLQSRPTTRKKKPAKADK